MGLRVAADIGGTFTDLAVFLADGTVATHKVPSTPDDYGRAVVEGLGALLAEVGVAPGAVGEVLHGCTVATNAILEGEGARTALVTTRGFRDVLEFRRVRVPKLYDPLYVRPEPLAPRELRFEVTERVAADGAVVTALREAEVRAAARAIRAAKAEAVAVCLLHSYANPAHERRVGAILRKLLPGVFVTLSVDVLPEIREYERSSTTVINAYVGPIVARYVAALATRLRGAKIGGRLLVMQSGGGILDARTVGREPARIVECGPAAGVIGAAHQAALTGCRDVITLDMGGTTAKASMIEGGRILRTDEYEVGGGISLSSRLVKGGGHALKLPVIDISEVGAGGGSLVWFDGGGALKVGPLSAGAAPGPACYAKGGEDATVTDANVVLGFVNPTALAGGTVPIDAGLARAAIASRAARPLRASLDDAAWAVFVVASATMMRAIKAVSTWRGRDPRDCALMAFGGNGGIFAVELARQLQVSRVLVPPAAGVFSALGLGVAPLAFSRGRAFLARHERVRKAGLARAFGELEREVVATLGRGRARVALRRAVAMRYAGQAFELKVPLAGFTASALDAAADAFEAEHARSYGHRLDRADGIDLVAIEVAAEAIDGAQPRPFKMRGGRPTPAGRRSAYFGPEHGRRATPVIDRAALGRRRWRGPLIVEEYEGTTVVPPGAAARLDRFGNIVIDVAP